MAVVDTGIWPWFSLVENTAGEDRYLVRYDAIRDALHLGDDGNGHGTHVASVIANSQEPDGQPLVYSGIAPDADLVSIKAFDDSGNGSYANVIRGIDWAVANREVGIDRPDGR